MDVLKRQVAEFVAIKEELKKMTERKNQLEKTICSTMDEFELDGIELPDKSTLSYRIKETLTVKKESKKKVSKD